MTSIFPEAPKPKTLKQYFLDNASYFGVPEKKEEKIEQLLVELTEMVKDNFETMKCSLKHLLSNQEDYFGKPRERSAKREGERSQFYK